MILPSFIGNSLIFPSRFHTLQNQHLFGQPLEVIVNPFFRYFPGINSCPIVLSAGPPISQGATADHALNNFSAPGISHVKVTDISILSAVSNNSGILPMITFSSSGVALVLRGNILKVFMLQYTINSNIKFMFYNIKNRKHQVYLDASRPKKQRYER